MASKITREPNNKIFVTNEESGVMIKTQTVEAHILLAILEKLEDINNNLVDIESNTDDRRI